MVKSVRLHLNHLKSLLLLLSPSIFPNSLTTVEIGHRAIAIVNILVLGHTALTSVHISLGRPLLLIGLCHPYLQLLLLLHLLILLLDQRCLPFIHKLDLHIFNIFVVFWILVEVLSARCHSIGSLHEWRCVASHCSPVRFLINWILYIIHLNAVGVRDSNCAL